MPSRPGIPKCTVACVYCRMKKAKCSGTNPCANCVAHGEHCKFPDNVARSRKRTRHEASLEERIASLEQGIERDNLRLLSNPLANAANNNGEFIIQQMSPASLRSSLTSGTALAPPHTMSSSVASLGENVVSSANALSSTSSLNTASVFKLQDCAPADASLPISDSYLPSPLGSFFSPWGINDVAPIPQRERSFVDVDQSLALEHEKNRNTEPENDKSEHHGRVSFLSICSPAGVEWVCRQLGHSHFHHSASRLVSGVTQRLKMSKPLGIERTPDPDYKTALEWTTAFFDESFEHSIGLVPRQAFEARLDEHYRCPGLARNDLTWYALRNTVFAIGSRLVALPERQSPNSAVDESLSWLYFENAFSAHTNLVYMPSDVSVVEVLVLMAYSCEAITCPKLEYMLLALAIRLGHSKGVHLHPPRQGSLTETEESTRRWVWWLMYVYDKHLAIRSGRPSMIHDEDITATLPTEARPNTRADLNFMLNAVKHAQISSAIERDLFSPKARGLSLDQLKNIVMHFDNQLRSWYAGIGAEYRTPTASKPRSVRPHISLTHVLYLHNCFHGSLCALHTIMTQPWKKIPFQLSQSPVHSAQVQESSRIVAEAARSIILQCQQYEINETSPSWLVFYFPVLGAIHLFIHVLRAPTSPSAHSDVALIDVAAGFFARLEYATSGSVAVGFVRDLAEFARLLVSPPRHRLLSGTPGNRAAEPAHPHLMGADDMPLDQLTDFDFTDLGPYEWPNLT